MAHVDGDLRVSARRRRVQQVGFFRFDGPRDALAKLTRLPLTIDLGNRGFAQSLCHPRHVFFGGISQVGHAVDIVMPSCGRAPSGEHDRVKAKCFLRVDDVLTPQTVAALAVRQRNIQDV